MVRKRVKMLSMVGKENLNRYGTSKWVGWTDRSLEETGLWKVQGKPRN
jgi:hypothetical protein